MKNFKIITLILFFFALFATSAIAQVQADAEINVGATVDNALTLTGIQNLEFGDISSSNTETISLDNDETSTSDGQQYGIFDLQAGTGNNVQLEVSNSITLTDLSDENLTMTYEPLIFRTDGSSNETLIEVGQTQHTINDISESAIDLYVGGDLSGDFDAGIYTGSLTLTVQYVE